MVNKMGGQARHAGGRPKKPKLEVPLSERHSWSVEEFCGLHGLSRATVYRRAMEGELLLSKSHRRTFITREAAEAWKARISAPEAAPVAGVRSDA